MGRVCYKLNPTPTIKELPAKDKRWVSFYRKKKKKKDAIGLIFLCNFGLGCV